MSSSILFLALLLSIVQPTVPLTAPFFSSNIPHSQTMELILPLLTSSTEISSSAPVIGFLLPPTASPPFRIRGPPASVATYIAYKCATTHNPKPSTPLHTETCVLTGKGKLLSPAQLSTTPSQGDGTVLVPQYSTIDTNLLSLFTQFTFPTDGVTIDPTPLNTATILSPLPPETFLPTLLPDLPPDPPSSTPSQTVLSNDLLVLHPPPTLGHPDWPKIYTYTLVSPSPLPSLPLLIADTDLTVPNPPSLLPLTLPQATYLLILASTLLPSTHYTSSPTSLPPLKSFFPPDLNIPHLSLAAGCYTGLERLRSGFKAKGARKGIGVVTPKREGACVTFETVDVEERGEGGGVVVGARVEGDNVKGEVVAVAEGFYKCVAFVVIKKGLGDPAAVNNSIVTVNGCKGVLTRYSGVQETFMGREEEEEKKGGGEDAEEERRRVKIAAMEKRLKEAMGRRKEGGVTLKPERSEC